MEECPEQKDKPSVERLESRPEQADWEQPSLPRLGEIERAARVWYGEGIN
jgi:hypothetical protein